MCVKLKPLLTLCWFDCYFWKGLILADTEPPCVEVVHSLSAGFLTWTSMRHHSTLREMEGQNDKWPFEERGRGSGSWLVNSASALAKLFAVLVPDQGELTSILDPVGVLLSLGTG